MTGSLKGALLSTLVIASLAVLLISTVSLSFFRPISAQLNPENITIVHGTENENVYQITLITGDTVIVSEMGGGGQRTLQIVPADQNSVLAFQTLKGPDGTYVLPNDADLDKLDTKFFNIDYLIERSYYGMEYLPVIISTARVASRTVSNQDIEKSAQTLGSVEAEIKDFNGEVTMKSPRLSVLAAKLPVDTIKESTETLLKRPDVEKIWLDKKVQVSLNESVPLIGAPELWATGDNGAGIKIAILDTGIDATHPDLNDLDDNVETYDPKVTVSVNFSDDSSADDLFGHGTHCAGIAAGTGEASNYLYRGVAPGAYLWNIKVLDRYGSGYDSWIISGIQYAALGPDGVESTGDEADVISMSFGANMNGDGTDPISTAVDWAVDHGVTCVAAAGNSGPMMSTVGMPAVARKVITVGATTKADTMASFSSRGPTADYRLKPDVVAPGVGIVAPRASGTSMGSPVNDYYTIASGTSMSTPHVAGAAALLLKAHPDWSPMMVKSALMGNAKVLENVHLWDQGAGRIRVPEAENTGLVAIEPSLSFGMLGSDENKVATLTLINLTDSSEEISISTYTECENVETDYVNVNPTSLTIPAHENADVLVQVGPLDENAPAGWYEGWINITYDLRALRVPLLFSALSTVSVDIYDLDNSKISAGIVLAEYPSMAFVSSASGSSAQFYVKGGNYAVLTQSAWIEKEGYWPPDWQRMFMIEKAITVLRLSEVHVSINLADALVSEIPTVDNAGENLITHCYAQYFSGDPYYNEYVGVTSMNWSMGGGWFGFDINVPKLTFYSSEFDPPENLSQAFGFYASDNLPSEVYLLNWKYRNVPNLPPTITYSYSDLAKYDFYYDMPETYPENGLNSMNAFWFTWENIGVLQLWGWDVHKVPAGINAKYYLTPLSATYWGYYMPTYGGWSDYKFGPFQEWYVGQHYPYPQIPPEKGEIGSRVLGDFQFAPYIPGLSLDIALEDGSYIISLTADIWENISWPHLQWYTWVENTWVEISPYPLTKVPYYHLYVDNVEVASGTLGRPDGTWYEGLWWDNIENSWEVTGEKGRLEIYMPSLATISKWSTYELSFDLADDVHIPSIFKNIVMPLNYSLDDNIVIQLEPPTGLENVALEYSFDNGASWEVPDGTYNGYVIPCENADELTIRISAMDQRGNSLVYTSSPASLFQSVVSSWPEHFSPPHSDYGLDTDNDNLYNSLGVEVNVSVVTPGLYKIYGSLYDNKWNWITSAWAENYLETGAQTLELKFEGNKIEESGKDGPYFVYLYFYDDERNWLDSSEHETAPYTHDQFQPPPAKLAPPHSDYGLDTDNDGLYNYLVVEANVSVPTAARYHISSSLYDNTGNYITDAWAENYLDAGAQTLELRFDGWRINRSERDGPYHVYMSLNDNEGNWLDSGEHWTAVYTHENFQDLAKFAPPHSDYGLDTDNDNLYNYLVVEVKVAVSTAGRYHISSSLYDNAGNYIPNAYASTENYLDVGTQKLELRFRGDMIQRSGGDGPYHAYLTLYDSGWNWLDYGEHWTAAYTHDNFQPLPAKLAPPHSDYGLDTDNDGLYNYLVVEANVAVTTAGTYRISGDLYDNTGNYIPNTYASAENYLDVGIQTIELRFRGDMIQRSGRDGSYRVSLDLYGAEGWLDSGEHWTQPYTHDQFQLFALFAPPHSDYGLDTDNDGLYNFLVVGANVSVSTAGRYQISGSLYDNTGNYITGSGWVENYLDVGTWTIELRFDGQQIERSGIDGPYRAYLWLYDNEWNWLDSGEHWTTTYTHDQFQPPPALFAPPHSDHGLDTDNDGLYNYLVVGARVDVITPGRYLVYGYLYDNAGNNIPNAYAQAENYLDIGTQTLELRFRGQEIERSGRDGPYRVSIVLDNYEYGWLDSGEYWTAAYTHDNFQPPPAKFAPPHSDNGLDTDNDNLYNYLVIRANVAVSTAGTYRISSSLYDNTGNYISNAYASTENYLDVGTQTIELRFNGWWINSSGRDGPYRVSLSLRDSEWNWLGDNEHWTAAYTHDNFQPPPAKLAPPHSDYGLDTDNDNLYNYLVVEANVVVATAGRYSIESTLYDNTGNSITWSGWVENYLDVGTRTIELRFKGYEIQRSGRDGPYRVSMTLYGSEGWLDWNEHWTTSYTHDQFQPPPAKFASPHSDYGLDTDNDNLFNYLIVEANVVVETPGRYHIDSSLYDNNGNYITSAWAENYLDAGTCTIELRFDGLQIRRSGMDGPYRVYLSLYGAEGWLDSGEHWTGAYANENFQYLAKFAPPHSDYILDTNNDGLYDYLVVEARVDVITPGRYRVYGNLYDNAGNNIPNAYAQAENYLDIGTHTIELRFRGYLIERSGRDGPYRVSMGLDSNYGWLGSGEHWTVVYMHDQFQPPPAKLAPPNSDYVLDTNNDGLYDYLVVVANVACITSGGYRISSSLYDNTGSYIAGAWAENYFDIGTQTIELRFIGYEIERSGRDGPYRVYMSLDNDDGNWLDENEYWTPSYSHENFQYLAKFAPPHSDYGLDTDNDSLYNYLVVEANLAVSTAGWYSISSSLYDNAGNNITSAWTGNYLGVGTQTIELRFKGYEIERSGRDGPYRVSMSLNGWPDSGEYWTATYMHDQFQPPPAVFFPPHSDYGLDIDNDNLYNYLVVEAKVSVATAGWYSISGNLYDGTGNYISNAYAPAENYLDVGTQTIELRFRGDMIQRSGRNGPYRAYLDLYGPEGWLGSGEYWTAAYTNDKFQPTKLAPPHSDYGLDTDNDNLYNYLIVDVNVAVATPGRYHISSSLYDNTGNNITGAWADNYLDVGTQTIELRFEGYEIERSGRDGPYRVSLRLYCDYGWLLDENEHWTAAYMHDQFQSPPIPPIKFAPPHSDYGLDTDNDNLYNFLVVEAKVVVATAGWYSISGSLQDHNTGSWITDTWAENYLDVGTRTIELRFEGYRIQRSGWDGPYRVYVYLYDDNGNWLGDNEHWTAAYTHESFQDLAKFAPPHSDYGLDTDHDGLYNYLVVKAKVAVATAGWYRIQSSLYDGTGYCLGSAWAENYLDVGTRTIELRFEGYRIERSGVNGHYRISMSLYSYNHDWLDDSRYWTAAYTHDQFQPPPAWAHSPIYIDGNDNFTAANGVVGGSGTGTDPFIIENWDIIADNANGIEIRNTTAHFVIRNCYVHDGWEGGYLGIYFVNVMNGVVVNATQSNNYLGIDLEYSDNNNISGNMVENNSYGIHLDSSDNNTLDNNTCGNNYDYGICLDYSDSNTIDNNLVKSNRYYGIELYSSNNNLISNNKVSNNSDYGIYLEYDSDNNLIYQNKFMNNARRACDYGSNRWDNGYPSGGNYWSEYTGTDIYKGENQNIPGSDGICDTSYDIYGGSNKDRYPLMNPMLAVHTEHVSGTTVVDARVETDVVVTITTNQAGSVTVVKYENNPGGSPPSGFTALGKYIEVRTDIPSENIVWPIEIRIYYTDDEVAEAGILENNLGIFYWDGSNWVPEPDSGVDIDNNYVWAFVNHLSPFAPMAKVNVLTQLPSPSPPSPKPPTPSPARDTTPPPTPSLISPGNGSTTADATPILDWSDVSDPSGVTYSLSIAKDPGFASILFDKSGLTVSTYELTSGESLPAGTYYWRVRAVDGAGNVGSWSENWSFTVSAVIPPVVTPPIGLALTMGIVAVMAIIAIGVTLRISRLKVRAEGLKRIVRIHYTPTQRKQSKNRILLEVSRHEIGEK
jgi:parallel beta-helix repeat protein